LELTSLRRTVRDPLYAAPAAVTLYLIVAMIGYRFMTRFEAVSTLLRVTTWYNEAGVTTTLIGNLLYSIVVE
jgi:hypothetical protein